MNPAHSLPISILLLACSSSPEPTARTANNQQQPTRDEPTTQAEPGPVVIVEPPEPAQTEPLTAEVDERDTEPGRQPEAASEWCPDCPQLCLDFVALMEACRDNLPPHAQPIMDRNIENTKLRFKSADTPEARGALKSTCQKGLDILRQQSLCR